VETGTALVLSSPSSHPWLSQSQQELKSEERLSDGLLRARAGLLEVQASGSAGSKG